MTKETPEQTSRRMAHQAVRDTKPEMVLRRLLFANGLRYRVDFRLPLPWRSSGDIVFPRLKLAVFVDGCFWHSCPDHGTRPQRNADWWAAKLDRNIERDRQTTEALRSAGWSVLRVWEHEAAGAAAQRIVDEVKRLQQAISDRCLK